MTAPEPDGTDRDRLHGDRDPARVIPWRDAAAVGTAALAVRLVVGLVVARTPKGLHDPLLYQGFARSIADGNGYTGLLGHPTTYYPPGYPLFLGAVQRLADVVSLGGHLPAVAAVVQAGLGAVAAGATVVAGRRLADRLGPARARRTALVAGLVVALWPSFVLYSGLLLSETLFVALFAVAVACLLELGDLRRPRPLPAVSGALAFGLAALVRPQVLLAVPFVALAWALARVGWRRVLVGVAVTLAGAAVCLVPWTIRNAVVMGHLVPISTNGGDNLCIGFHDGATGGYDFDAPCQTDGSYVDGPDVEVRRDAQNRDRAISWITSHPASLPWLTVRKVWRTFASDSDGLSALESYGDDAFLPDGARSAIGWFLDLSYLLIATAALGGVVALAGPARQRRTAPLLVLALTAQGVVVPALFFGDPRFKVALVPCLALLAGVAVDAAAAWWAGRGGPGAGTAVVSGDEALDGGAPGAGPAVEVRRG